jgi:bacterioferritin
MKGNERILQALNDRLAEELTAINQYMVHSEMCENWGYLRLHKGIRAQAMDEMHHAEWLDSPGSGKPRLFKNATMKTSKYP